MADNEELKKILAVVCALILPPLGVLVGGGTAGQFILNILLTLFFWIPGLLHALWVILKK
jgi:uncharacterized membrane protein YqaE (UPF0057 family)